MSTVQVIESQNPSEEELVTIISEVTAAAPSCYVKATELKFKKTKDKDTGVESTRTPLILAVPYPKAEDIVAAGGKELDMLQEIIESAINDQVRSIISEDVNINAATLPLDKITWAYIANMPKGERRGGGIPKQVWEDFGNDYITVMQTQGKTAEQAANAAKLFLNKLQSVKTNEAVLNHLMRELTKYSDATPNLEQYAECVEFLVAKIDAFLNVSEEDLLANL